jgi:A/G-specific adenine glycosylase
MTHQKFKKEIWKYYRLHRRDFPWRPPTLKLRKDGTVASPYRVLVSEIMLQQTQTDRVMPKYNEFLNSFPDFQALADAPVSKALAAWQGLGYNRRALYLQRIAKIVMQEYGGKLPSDIDILDEMPGIGRHTAGSILAFAFDRPAVFIETNIRRVFIHFFFPS